MSAREHAFDSVGGVPTHYARQPVATYGTIGVQRSFHCTHAFFRKLDACFRELWRVCPRGQARAVVSAGAQVNKSGFHGHGRAFDIDAIFWSTPFITNNFNTYPEFYLGVEAVLRKHFGVVLGYNYNAAHRDHFHIDDSVRLGFSRARSHTLFMQGVCYYMLGKRFRGNVDGRWGSTTRRVVDEACAELGVSTPLTTLSNWNSFLDAVAGRGMPRTRGRSLPADHSCTSHGRRGF